jgi:hypothetical protein
MRCFGALARLVAVVLVVFGLALAPALSASAEQSLPDIRQGLDPAGLGSG